MSYFGGLLFLGALVFGGLRNPEVPRWTFYSRAIPALAVLTQTIDQVPFLGPPIRAAVLLALTAVILITALRIVTAGRASAEPPPVF